MSTQPKTMLVYDTEDSSGAKSRHLAVSKEAAAQAHLVHFGLLSENVKISDGIPLISISNRKSICWESQCIIIGARN